MRAPGIASSLQFVEHGCFDPHSLTFDHACDKYSALLLFGFSVVPDLRGA